MSGRALILVDIQPTFCEGGALAVEGGDAVAQEVAALLMSRHGYDLIVSTQDWHIDPGDHFSDEPDFVDTWPPHGVAGSAEAELHPALADVIAEIDVQVKKGMDTAAYSGFEGVDTNGWTLDDVLAASRITSVDVAGLAFDHCVRATAIDAVKAGYATRVLEKLTASVAATTAEAARAELETVGVTLVS